MNLAMGRGRIHYRLLIIHRDVGTICLTRIHVLEQAISQRRFPEHQLIPVVNRQNLRLQCACFVRSNLANGGRRIEWTSHTTRFGSQPQLLVGILPDDSRVEMQLARTLCLS